jgi:hypothetical protein
MPTRWPAATATTTRSPVCETDTSPPGAPPNRFTSNQRRPLIEVITGNVGKESVILHVHLGAPATDALPELVERLIAVA